MSQINRGRTTIGAMLMTLVLGASLGLFLLYQARAADFIVSGPDIWDSDHTYDTLTINAALTIDSSVGGLVTITANNIIINSGGSINADGKGCAGGAAGANGATPTGQSGSGIGSASYSGGGGGYGGVGGAGYNGGAGGLAYGTIVSTYRGSGGGGGATSAGGAGGGAMKLVVSGKLIIDGVISANGSDGVGGSGDYGGGGGSGGSIYIDATLIEGGSNITANGGDGAGTNLGGAGGGGRAYLSFNDNTNYTGTVTASKGVTGSGTAADGTVSEISANPALYTGGSGAGYDMAGAYHFYTSSTDSIWDGTGADNLASTAANWTGDTLPATGNTVLFTYVSTKDCTWDLATTISDFTIDQAYTGTITSSQNLTATGNLSLQNGALALGANLTVSGNISLQKGTLDAGSYTITAGGNWTKTTGNTFTCATSTVTLNGTTQAITGTTAFYNLTKSVTTADTLTIDDASTITVGGHLNLTGAQANLLTIVSDVTGTQYDITLSTGGTQDIEYTAIKDCNANNGLELYAKDSTDSGNNLNIIFDDTGQDLEAGRIGWWKLDDNAATVTVTDSSGYAHNGTLYDAAGTATTAAHSAPGAPELETALEFDGTDDYVSIGAAGTSVKSITYWINPTGVNESVIDLDGGTHYIAANYFPYGFTSPITYIDGELTLNTTVTQADCKKSLVDGTAFIDIGVDLSAYAGADSGTHTYKLILEDSAGNQAIGYIGASGGGETTNNTYTSDFSVGIDGWGKLNGTLVGNQDGISDGATSKDNCLKFYADASTSVHRDSKNVGTVAEKLYRLSYDHYIPSGETTLGGVSVDEGAGLIYPNDSTTGTWVAESAYYTSFGASVYFYCTLPGGGTTWTGQDNPDDDRLYLYNVVVDEITDCSTDGVHIISTADGSAQNWESIDAEFSYNDSSGYTARIVRADSASINQWHHVAVTTDTAVDASALTLAKVGSNYLNGTLDDVRLYDRVLTPNEVSALGKDYTQKLTWQGDVSASWNEPTNWDKGRVPSATDAVVIPAACTYYPTLPGATTLSSLQINSTGSLSLGGYNLNVTYLICNGTLTASANEQITITRELDLTGATFTTASSKVILSGADTATVKGDGSFYDLSCTTAGKTINFTAGTTQTISNNFTLTGTQANPLTLNSTVTGTQFNINTQIGKYDVTYVNARDCNASSGDYIVAYDSTDSGNNTNWFFGIAGTCYWTNAAATGLFSTAGNWFEGAVPGVDSNVVFNEISIADCSVDTAAIVASFTIQDGYTGTIILSADVTTSGNVSLQNGTLAAGNRAITVGGNWTKAAAAVFTQVAVTLNMTGDSAVFSWPDDLILSTLTMSGAGQTLNLGNSFTITGQWTPSTSTVSFTATDTGNTITIPAYSAASPLINKFYNLTFNGSGGGWNIVNDLKVANDFTLTQGAFSSNNKDITIDRDFIASGAGIRSYDFGSSSVSVARHWDTSGTDFTGTYGTSTVEFTSAASANIIHDGITFYKLKCLVPNKTLSFIAAKDLTANSVMFKGADSQLLNLVSSVTGTSWGLITQGAVVDYAAVSDSDASGGTAITASRSTDNLRNTNWVFVAAPVAYWIGEGADNNWSTAANWSTDSAPTSANSAVFGAISSKNCTVDTAATVIDFTIESTYTGAITLGANLTASGNITLNAGTLNAGTATITAAGNWTKAAANTFTCATSSVTLNGAAQTLTGTAAFYNLTKSVSSADTLTIDDASTITVGGLLTLTGALANPLTIISDVTGTQYDITLSAGSTQDIEYTDIKDCNASGGLELYAASSTDSGNNLNIVFPDDGGIQELTWEGDASASWSEPKNWDKGRVPAVIDIAVIPTGCANYPTLPANTTLRTLQINTGGTLTLGGHNLSVTYLTCNGTLIASATEQITVTKELDMTGATFTTATSKVILSGADTATVKGSTTFYDLSCTTAGKTINFTAGTTQTVSNNFTLTGTQANPLTLNSTTTGTQWNINCSYGHYDISYINVSDSDASSGDKIVAYDSTDSGNNLNWFFGQAGDNIWTNAGVTGLFSTAANWSTLSVPGAADSAIFNEVSVANCTVDQAVNVINWTMESGYTGIVSAGSNTITASGNWTKALTNTFTQTAATLNMIGDNTTLTCPDDLALAVLTMSGATGQELVLGGSLVISNQFTSGTCAAKFTATATGKTIDIPVYSAASPTLNKFYNLTFDGAGGEWKTINNLRIENDFTLVQGTFNDNNKYITIGNDLIASGASTRGLTFGAFTWTAARDCNLSGSNMTVNRASSTLSVGRNWDSSGTNTINVGTSTVELIGTGTLKTAEGVDTFYNLSCAASGMTTTLDCASGVIEPYIIGVLTLGGGTLAKTGADTGTLSLRNIGTPFILGASTITDVIIRYKPASIGTVNIAGGDYGTGIIDAYSTVASVTYSLADSVTGASGLNIYADTGVTTIFNLNNYNLTLPYLKLGDATAAGAVTTNSGSGTITFTAAAGLSVKENGGSHILNLDSSTWNIIGNWQLTSGTGAITANTGASSVVFSDNLIDSYIYGDNTFYNLKCLTPGKLLYLEDAKTQAISNNLILSGGASTTRMLLRSISGGDWNLDVDGSGTVVYVDVAHSNALPGKAIVAAGSLDSGFNTNWTFTEVGTIYWTGTGEDSNWSTSENWSTVSVPGATEDVIFDNSSIKDCAIDTAVTVKSITINTGYTGTITLGANFTVSENFTLSQGGFNAASYAVSIAGNMTSSGSGVRSISLGTGAWTVGGNWDTSGSSLTLTFSTASLTMSGAAVTMNGADYTFNSLTLSGATSAAITCGGSFDCGTFSSPTIKPSITFTATAIGKAFESLGQEFLNVAFNGAGGGWTLSDDLSLTGTLTISAGGVIDNGRTVSFKDLNIANSAGLLTSTGTWTQADTGTITSVNSSNKFAKLSICAAGKTTTLGSDVYTDIIEFAAGTLAGSAKTLYISGDADSIISPAGFTVSSALTGIETENHTTQGVFHLPDNLVTGYIDWYRNTGTGAITATGNWDFGNNRVRFYENTGQTGVIDLGAYNLTAGEVNLGYTAIDNNCYLDLGSGTHSIGSFSKAYSGTVTGVLSLDLGSSTINNYSGSLNLTPLTFDCGTSLLNFSGGSGAKAVTTAANALYSLGFNDADSTWALQDSLVVNGDLSLTSGIFSHNNQKITLVGADIAQISGAFTFYDLECAVAGKEIKFEAGKTQTVEHLFTLTGASSNRVKISSQTPGTQWSIDALSASVSLAEVKDSNAIKAITAERSVDSGNNTNWTFSPIIAWDGGGATNNWSEAGNWEDDTVPTADVSVIFDATSVKDCTIDAAVTIKDFVVDNGYTGTITIGVSGGITSTDGITLSDGTLVDNAGTVSFKDLIIADEAGRLTSTGTWTQADTGSINSPNSSNRFNKLVITAAAKTTTLVSDIYTNIIEFGSGTLTGAEKTLYVYGDTDSIISPAVFTVGSTLAAIKTFNHSAQGAFYLPNNLVSGHIDWYRDSGAIAATGAWNFGNNDARFYADAGATGVINLAGNNLTAGDVYLGKDTAGDNNCYLNLGSGTHSLKSLTKAYLGVVTGSLELQLSSSTLNCTGDMDLSSINVIAGTSTLNLTGTLVQNITTNANSFNALSFSGTGPFNITGNFDASSAVVTEVRQINCTGSFALSSGFEPGYSTVTLTSTSVGNLVDIPLASSFYNLEFNGAGGEWTLQRDFTVDNTLSISAGKFIDNAKAVSFKNVSIADSADLLASTGTWTQVSSGELRCPNSASRISTLSICGTGITTTFSGDAACDTVVFGNGILVGSARNLSVYGTVNSIECPAVFTVNSALSAIYTENHTSQGVFHLPDGLVIDKIFWLVDTGYLDASGDWDFGDNDAAFYTTSAALGTIRLSTSGLTCGALQLGSSQGANYPAYLNLGSGTHNVGAISKAYIGTPTGSLNLLMSSSTLNCSGSIDFTNIIVNSSTSTLNMQDSTGARSLTLTSQELNNLNFNDNDTTWTLQDDLTVKGDLSLTAGTFTHANKKVIISGAGVSRVSGSFTFYDFECTSQGKEIQFEQSKTQTVAGTFTITGGAGGRINLFSQSLAEKWFLNPTGASVAYANTRDSTSLMTIVAIDSIDSGNNTGWIIGGSLDITSPVQADRLYTAQVVDISWQTVSGVTSVMLYYTTNASNAAPVWKTITTTAISNNPDAVTTYQWVAPDDISADCKIKVVAVVEGEEAAELYDTSGIFEIMGVLGLTYPNVEGLGWPADTLRRIGWTTTGTVSDVKVYCSIAGTAGPWTYLGTTGTNEYYDWRPGDTYTSGLPSDNCYIKITDDRYEDVVYDVSDYRFKLGAGSISDVIVTDLSGVGKTALASGSSYQIRWATTGSVGTVDISYSVDGGANWTAIASAVTNDDRYDGVDDNGPWLIEYTLSDNVLIKVADSSDSVVFGASETASINALFTITAPALDETLLGGSDCTITWETMAGLTISNVKIEYSLTGAAPWTEINAGSYTATNDWSESWEVPEESGATVKLRISNVLDTTGYAYALSDVFKIKRGSIAVTAPNTALIWKVDSSHEIEWTVSGDVASVKLFYCVDGDQPSPAWKAVVEGAMNANLLKYMWSIPNDVSDNCLIKIEDADDTDIFDLSNALFSIKPELILNAPNGGQNWVVGKAYDIIWTTVGTIPGVMLEYSINGGTAWTDITTAAITNNNIYTWVVPEMISDNCLIRVSSSTDEAVFDKSYAAFSISLASIEIISPVEGNIWAIGDREEITWQTSGTVYNNLTIEFSANGTFSDVVVITAGGTNDGSYFWDITGVTASSLAKLRIRDITWEDKGYDVSGTSAVFEVTAPRVDIIQPDGGETLIAGAQYEIQWASRGDTISSYTRIDYSPTGDFVNNASEITASTDNDGSFLWTVPDDISNQVKLRIYDAQNLSIYDDSAGFFDILGSLTLTAPASQSTLFVSVASQISWATVGTIAQVKLSYSSTGEGSDAVWYDLGTISNAGLYTWTIPDIVYSDNSPNPNVILKIEDASDARVYDTRQFTASYYTAVWSVVDEDGLVGHLSALVVDSVDVDSGKSFESRSGLKSPVSLYYHPDKTYNSVWSRDAYLETSLEGWVADTNGKTLRVEMPSRLIEKERSVHSEAYYDAATDLLSLSAWLQEQEKMIPKEDLVREIYGVSETYVEIFDEADNVLSSSTDAFYSTLNDTGVYVARWNGLRSDGLLVSGKRYFIRVRVMYQGAYHWGGSSFEITEAMAIQEITTRLGVEEGETVVSLVEGQIGTIGTTITAKIDAEAVTTQAAVASRAAETQTAVSTIGTTLTSRVAATRDALTTKVRLESASRILNQQSTIRRNETLTVRYKTDTGLAPVISVYDPKHNERISDQLMTETITGISGIYEYKVRFAWGVGEHTIICKEEATGTLDGLNIEVISTDLEDISTSITTATATLAGIDTDELGAMSSKVAEINAFVSKMVASVDSLTTLRTKTETLAGDASDAIYKQLEIATHKLREINEGQGIKIEKMYDLSEEQSEDTDYIKNKTLEIKALVELSQDILAQTNDEPIVKSWLESS